MVSFNLSGRTRGDTLIWKFPLLNEGTLSNSSDTTLTFLLYRLALRDIGLGLLLSYDSILHPFRHIWTQDFVRNQGNLVNRAYLQQKNFIDTKNSSTYNTCSNCRRIIIYLSPNNFPRLCTYFKHYQMKMNTRPTP